jgi:hypothetical protein
MNSSLRAGDSSAGVPGAKAEAVNEPQASGQTRLLAVRAPVDLG